MYVVAHREKVMVKVAELFNKPDGDDIRINVFRK